MTEIKVFTTRQQIYELTGITPNEHDTALWDAGFNLDDWDWGICMDVPMSQKVERVVHYNGGDYSYIAVNKDGERQWKEVHVDPYDQVEHDDCLIPDVPYWMEVLFNHWDGYCVGGSHTEYGGKHYYIWHHS